MLSVEATVGACPRLGKRPHRRRLAVAGVAPVVALGWWCPARAAEEVLTTVPHETAIVAYGGEVVWSQLDRAAGGYRLMRWHAGVVAPLDVPPRTVPFDVDVGPDHRGLGVAMYSRCANDPAVATLVDRISWRRPDQRCDVFRAPLVGGGEGPVERVNTAEGSESAPSIWRGDIAFARRARRSRAARLWLARRGHKRLVALGRGTVKTCFEQDCGRARTSVRELDLGPARAAYVWRLDGSPMEARVAFELRAAPRDGAPSQLVDGGGIYETGSAPLYSPNAGGSRVLWSALSWDGGPEVETWTRLWPPRRQSALLNPPVKALARDGGTVYLLRRAPGFNHVSPSPVPHELVRTTEAGLFGPLAP